jgi:hypothetical protein
VGSKREKVTVPFSHPHETKLGNRRVRLLVSRRENFDGPDCEKKKNKLRWAVSRVETWTDALRGDPSDCKLIGGDRDLRA